MVFRSLLTHLRRFCTFVVYVTNTTLVSYDLEKKARDAASLAADSKCDLKVHLY